MSALADYSGFLTASELERHELDCMRSNGLRALHKRSLTQSDWRRVREEALAPGLEISEMNAAQLCALLIALEELPLHRPAAQPAEPKAKKSETKGKPFGWAQK